MLDKKRTQWDSSVLVFKLVFLNIIDSYQPKISDFSDNIIRPYPNVIGRAAVSLKARRIVCTLIADEVKFGY